MPSWVKRVLVATRGSLLRRQRPALRDPRLGIDCRVQAWNHVPHGGNSIRPRSLCDVVNGTTLSAARLASRDRPTYLKQSSGMSVRTTCQVPATARAALRDGSELAPRELRTRQQVVPAQAGPGLEFTHSVAGSELDLLGRRHPSVSCSPGAAPAYLIDPLLDESDRVGQVQWRGLSGSRRAGRGACKVGTGGASFSIESPTTYR